MPDAQRPRPRIHFTPQSGWMNDPLAVTWHDGLYHLFFQYVPGRTTWAPECRWGHATSPDLVTWTEHPVALEPGDGDDGIWSGSIAVDDEGRPTIFYTAVSTPDFGVGRIRTATPVDDDWLTWAKGDVVVEAPPLDLVAFRDPFLLRDGDRWRMLVGTAIAGGDAAASSFVSHDLADWTYEGLAASRSTRDTEPVWTGTLWECPQIFSVGDRDVMVTSVWDDDDLHYVVYAIGEFTDGRFEAAHWGRLTFGDSYYAPSFFRDRDGQPCLIYWMRGALDEEAGRASALSVPHVLHLEGDSLIATPHPAVATAAFAGASSPAPLTIGIGDRIQIANPAGPLLLHRDERAVRCSWNGQDTEVPAWAGAVDVLVDAETVEVFAGHASFAVGADAPFSPVWRGTQLSD
ncbi:glycoside hydrolase family 32 protein [Herbiconiux sp. CPCC 203407]|uniref:beta-fructofuranosidase n=1 Tax=Herbiconiux oxytropis TaxID=2970915 RepID=A0AA41XIN8_9MICO|nr:glycoside hydrolase family 32 protein [Herbiconiux oxytropis]MCS5721725.1 glycoside hydrolase family 32 protein [Herbiconiux oxytropis]MCS5726648.1 glycoside hydrolase family 32 protein [Herbiconiux oxytropis]